MWLTRMATRSNSSPQACSQETLVKRRRPKTLMNPTQPKRYLTESCGFQQFLVVLFAFVILSSSLTGITGAQEVSPSPSPPASPAPLAAPSVTAPATDKAQLHQALLDLTNPYTVMCVAAHPDDEDGTTLTVLRRKNGVHTVSLFSTYGEGGQNAVGPELYEELGVIRAQETMKAAQIQGSEPYFLGLKDFGFSKSADEAFRVWGHDEALRRMVLKIRELRPDVIITNHDTTSGHGHHQATGRLIIEAFDAAADPKRFPEQLEQVKPWQAQRLFVRIFSAPQNDNKAAVDRAGAEEIVAIDPNEVDPVRGTSFAEQALAALQQHATQGPWPKSMAELLRARGIEAGKLPLIRYQLVRQAANVPTLPDDAMPFLGALKVPEALSIHIEPFKNDAGVLTDFLDQPTVVLESLIEWRKTNSRLESASEDPQRAQLMRARFDRALALAANVKLTLTSSDSVLVPAKTASFNLTLTNGGDRSIDIDRVWFSAWGQQLSVSTADQILPDTETSGTVDVATPADVKPTVPKDKHLYDGLLTGKRFGATAELEIDGVRFSVVKETYLDIAPGVEIQNIEVFPYVITPATSQSLTFNIALMNHLPGFFRGLLKINGQNLETGREIALEPGEQRSFKIEAVPPVARPVNRRHLSSTAVTVSVALPNPRGNVSIARRTVFTMYADARVSPKLRVAYLPSFDETLSKALTALGVDAKQLTVANIQSDDLQNYDSIVIDNRGYEAHPELVAANSRLLDFVKAGGTLIVFYHKSNEWNPDPKKKRPQLAPYPIILGDERVTDETAPVKFLTPRHSLLNFPNRITQADFENWIQERGLYYPKEWDNHYTALFAMNDAGEKPLSGGLLVAPYGKGNYIYTSMVWYRQLRAGVPGGYRMLANLISYRHK
ncbi:MAG TPA: hypothetical protein DHU55_12015 [Blastocatellia bacterium]|nr:hypothetical protein [Blastocatellia bacterium]